MILAKEEIFTKTVYVRVKYQLSMSRFIRDRSTVCLSFLTNVFICWEVSGGCLGKRVGTPILHRVQWREAIIGVTGFLWDRFW